MIVASTSIPKSMNIKTGINFHNHPQFLAPSTPKRAQRLNKAKDSLARQSLVTKR